MRTAGHCLDNQDPRARGARLRFAALFLCCLVPTACGRFTDGGALTSEAWVGTITTEGGVTAVHNESGSVWGGPGTLVEEASIGVDAGEDPYMLGRVRGMAAAEERIYVVDSQVPALRVYDWGGTYLRDIGTIGEGPGEFRSPSAVGIDGQGRIWVHDQGQRRIVVFSPDGEVVATVSLGGARISGGSQSMVLSADGQAYVLDIVRPDEPAAPGLNTASVVMKPYGIDGVAGEPIDIPQGDDPAFLEARSERMIRFTAIPFRPNVVQAFASSRDVLYGYPDTYRFEVRHPDGTTTVVERAWTPVPVSADEAAAHEKAATTYMREVDPEWSWGEATIPATKPAFSKLLPTESGEVWVVRNGPAAFDPDCSEEDFELDGQAHCWPEQRFFDVFDADGRYLGEVPLPDHLELDLLPFIRGNDVIARVEDDAGTIMVKRYRLMLPEQAP